MTNQSQKSNLMKRPSLHNKNFEHYITEYAVAAGHTMAGEKWEAALAAARRLDYTGNRDAEPNMKLTPSQPSFVRRLVTRLLLRTSQREHLSELDDIQAFLRQKSEALRALRVSEAPLPSEIIWGPLRNGFGTWVIAILRPGGQQKGSRPTPARLRDAPGWELLKARKLLNGKPLYVRAHLLHHEPGGVGVDYDLAILTAAAIGDFGANHANWVHRYLVEGQLLWAYRNMRGLFGTPTITEIYYEVLADYNRQPREGTEELQQIANAYWEVAKLIQAKEGAEGGRAELPHQQVMNELAKNPPSAHLHDAMLAVTAKSGEDWLDVHDRIMANQQLWQVEDQNVPRALIIRYSWVENGVLRGPHEETVSIILPSSLAARFEA